MLIPEKLVIQPWATTVSPELGFDVDEYLIRFLNQRQVEFVPTCNDSPCVTGPDQTLRAGITAMMALITAQQVQIDDLLDRVDALENP